jgi:GNAT superfamily N-acetyltransferase
MEITRIEAAEAVGLLPQLAALLCDAVSSGASLGFLPPLSSEEAASYWQGIARVLGAGCILLVAREEGAVVGTVQLHLADRPNAGHRAEVTKLMVQTTRRGAGIGRALMEAIEEQALAAGRTTLILDTRAGDASQWLYRSMGWVEAGTIPRYARSADGALHTSVFMYKLLGDL